MASQFRGIPKSIRLDFEKIYWSKTSNSQTYAKREQGNWPRRSRSPQERGARPQGFPTKFDQNRSARVRWAFGASLSRGVCCKIFTGYIGNADKFTAQARSRAGEGLQVCKDEVASRWLRAMAARRYESETDRLIGELDVEHSSALEISGLKWKDRGFASYTTVGFPGYDVCSNVLEEKFDVIIAEQVFEHVLWLYPRCAMYSRCSIPTACSLLRRHFWSGSTAIR